MNLNHRLFNYLKLLAFTCILSACGGGGGGNDLHFNSFLNANVAGLEETSGLVLKVNGNGIVRVNKLGTTTLANEIPVGNSFNVSVQKQPEDFQWCSLQNNSGVISENGNMVDVSCTTSGIQGTTLARAADGATYRNGTLATAAFKAPNKMVMDQTGNLYVYDENYVVRKISPDGTVSLYAGQPGTSAVTDGNSNTATISTHLGHMAIDKDGIIYFTDSRGPGQGGLIRKIAKDGSISTFFDMSLDGAAFFNVGGRSTSLKGLGFDSVGDLFVVDDGQRVVYRIKSDKSITIFAGTPYSSVQAYSVTNSAPKDGGVNVGFLSVINGIAIDQDDNLHLTEAHGYRKVDRNGVISTPVTLTIPSGVSIREISVDKYKNVYLSGLTLIPNTSALIIKVSSNGKINTLAGKNASLAGHADGVNSEFLLGSNVRGLILDSNGHLIVSDTVNNAIRKVIPFAP